MGVNFSSQSPSREYDPYSIMHNGGRREVAEDGGREAGGAVQSFMGASVFSEDSVVIHHKGGREERTNLGSSIMARLGKWLDSLINPKTSVSTIGGS